MNANSLEQNNSNDNNPTPSPQIKHLKNKPVVAKLVLVLLFVLLLMSVVLSYFLFLKNKQLRSQVDTFSKTDKPDTDSKTSASVGGLLKLDEDIYVHFRGKEIAVLSNKGSGFWVLSDEQYPKLFEKTDSSLYAYTAELMDDKVHDKQFLILYLNIYEAAGYRPIYGLVLNIEEQKQVYEMPSLWRTKPEVIENGSVVKLDLAGPLFWSTCMNCHLRILEFVGYESESGMFVPVNNRFRSEFTKLLEDYNKIANENCKWQGKVTPVSEIQKIAGEDTKCDDNLGGSSEQFITIKEFNKLREDIQGVIDGRIISMLKKSDQQELLNITGVIRTSGLLVEEKKTLGLSTSDYQITSFPQGISTDLGVQGYYLESGEILDDYLGKCVSIEGYIKSGWEEIKDKDFTINDKYTYSRGALTLKSVNIINYSRCFESEGKAVKITPSADTITLKGVFQHSTRPAPDIGYDYELMLFEPYFDELNAQGITNINKIEVVPSPNITIPTLESFISKEVTLEGQIEWGYAESRVFRASRIY